MTSTSQGSPATEPASSARTASGVGWVIAARANPTGAVLRIVRAQRSSWRINVRLSGSSTVVDGKYGSTTMSRPVAATAAPSA